MGHRDAMSPERCGAVRGGAAAFPAAQPSNRRPFNNSVISYPIGLKFFVRHPWGTEILGEKFCADPQGGETIKAASHLTALTDLSKFKENLSRKKNENLVAA